MRRLVLSLCAFLFLVLVLSLPAAAAPVRWTLQNVSFGPCHLSPTVSCLPGGTATGYFIFDRATNRVSDWTISVQGGDETVFPALVFSPVNSTAEVWGSGGDEGLTFSGPEYPAYAGRNRLVALAFAAELTDSGGSVAIDRANPYAAECYNCNPYREFASGSVTGVPEPAPRATTVAAGFWHTCAVTSAGAVVCWGGNGQGQLGDGTVAERLTPVPVTGLSSGVVAVTAGAYHTCALTSGGAVLCWGNNAYGELGDGTTGTLRLTPVPVSGLTGGVVAVAAGMVHTCAVTNGGAVLCWGSNFSGQLGDGTNTDRSVPVQVSGLTSGAVAVTVGEDHTCALTSGGAVLCWGDNWRGQLGDGTWTSRATPVTVVGLSSGATAVAAGLLAHTCALTTGGAVQCWGDNSWGQLGDGTTDPRLTPVALGGLRSGVAALAAGWGHTCALMSTGTVKCWGWNSNGELGDGTTDARLTPVLVSGVGSGVAGVAAGYGHTCALARNGAVRCWGANDSGQLGDGTTTDRLTPVFVTGFTYHPQGDYDGDGKADVAVYRATSGTWFSLDSSTANTSYRYRGWGVQAEGDLPVPGDFDGDGIIDPTVYRPSTGTWFILESHANFTTWNWFGWGVATDTLVPGDYDGDGKTDAAVYRPTTGEWFIRPSSGASQWSVTFGGQGGDIPLPGDYDGDAKTDIAVYRPASGTWFILKSSSGFVGWTYQGWGVQAEDDVPVPGDYDGDGKTDPCVFRPASGTWFILESHTAYATWSWSGWGNATDRPMPADYDGDGKDDLAIYRPSTGEWYIKPSSGATPWSVVFGQGGDVPLQGIR